MANTYVDYTATAGQTDFNFSFPYLEDSHVVVEVEGVNQVLTTNYTIETSPAQKIILSNPTTALAGGELVRIKRVSDPSTDLVDFVNGSVLTETELDRAYRHNRYLSEEAYDGVNSGLKELEGSTNFNANNKQIKNLADGTLATDAVNKGYVDTQIALTDTNLAGFYKSTHTGNGTDNVFTLSFTPQTTDAKAYIVSIDGLVQVPDTDYTIGATDITFNTIPTNSAEICVVATAAASVATVNEAQVTATGSTTARSLANRFADVVNVLDYGVSTAASAADNTTAFNNAIAQGGRIYVPEGQYEVNSITINNSCRIFGEGTIYRSAVSDDAAFTITASDVQIEGLKFKGSSYGAKPTADNSADNAIEVNGGSTPTQLNNFKFSKLDINGFLGFGIRINYATHVTVDNNNINYMGYAGILGESLIHGKITKNSISYVGTLVSKTAGSFVIGERYKIVTVGTTDFTLIGSADNDVGTEFVATGVGSGTGTARSLKDAYGISLSREPSVSVSNSARSVNCVVSDNNISNVSDWVGIDCHAAYKCIISNNNVYGCKYSVNLQYDDDTATYKQPCEDIIVSNNVFFGLGSSDEKSSRSAIICIGYQDNLINKKIHISGNLIEDSGFYYDPFGAIYISSTEGAVVENNTIVKSVRAGIGVGTYVSDSVFRNNQINGSKAGDSSAFYLYLDDSAGHSGNLFEGNRCYNNTDIPTYDPVYGIAYRSGGTGNTFSKNRIKDLEKDIYGDPGTDYLYKLPSPGIPGVSNTYDDLKWILETNSGQSSDTLVSTNTSQIINVLLPRNAYGTFGVSKIAVANMYPFTSANITAAIVNAVLDADEIEVRVYTVDGSAFGTAFTVSPFLLVHCICWED